jgi:hypothetical protein
MKLSPALSIEVGRSQWVRLLGVVQVLVLVALFWVLPLPIAVCSALLGGCLLLRSRGFRPAVRRLILRGDASASLDGGSEVRLTEAQNFLSVQVLGFSNGQTLWLWPDALSAEHAGSLRRWLIVHAPSSRTLSP